MHCVTPSATEGKLARAEAVAQVKERALARVIPDPKAEGAIDPHSVRQ